MIQLLFAQATQVNLKSGSPDRSSFGVMRLRDGRSLSYAEYGHPAGRPVFLLHGTPGSRLDFEGWSAALTSRGLRGIAVDRPGMGRSTAMPHRTLLDTPWDIAQLADRLGIRRFSVLGASGGGPHALACGLALESQVEHVVLLCTAVCVQAHAGRGKTSANNRVGLFLGRRLPGVLAALLTWQVRIVRRSPQPLLNSLRRHVGPEDAARLDTVLPERVQRDWLEAYAQGVDGVLRESVIHSHPWPFSPARVRVPVSMWHGQADRLSPLEGARALAKQLPHAHTHFLEGHGHLLDLYPETLGLILDRVQPPR